MASRPTGSAFTRRTLLGAAGSAAAVGLLAACSRAGTTGGGTGGAGGSIKFWNMPWGQTAFNPLDKKITQAYKPASGLPSAQYQVIQWANFTQTFSSAVASNTGPAVSSGGGTQAFLYEAQGKIAYANDLIDAFKKDGTYDDFLPGLVDTLNTKNGYAAVPYNLDMRVIWVNTALLEKAGVSAPKDWDEWEKACAALKKIGVYGYGTEAGAGAYTGVQGLVGMMINNGGGLFDGDQQPDCVTDANIQAIDFVIGLVKSGYVDPRSVTYTAPNSLTQWQQRKYGIGWNTGGNANNVGGAVKAEMAVLDPPTGPTGKKGALFFPNNIMMYKNTPSQKGSEAFLQYYYKNMAPLWTQQTGIGLPPLKSIAETAEFKKDQNAVDIIEKWQPISKTWGAPGQNTVFQNVTTVDGTPATDTFAQQVLSGKVSAKQALTTLQDTLAKNAKKS